MNRPPAVVVGMDVNGLGIARSLAAAGIRVISVDTEGRRSGMWSRYGEKAVVEGLSGRVLVDELLALGSVSQERPVLFPTREDTVATVSRYRDVLARRFRFTLPPDTVLRCLTDKDVFHRAAIEFGLPVPRTVVLEGPGPLREMESLRYPCVLKPAIKSEEYAARFPKAIRVGSAAELIDIHRRVAEAVSRCVVQEYVDGRDSDLFFCLFYMGPAGAVVSFTGRKLRSWPPRIGGTASCTAAPEQGRELEPMAERFFMRIGALGLVSMEFKRHARTGQWMAVEPTVGRTDYQEEVASLNGINIPRAAYCAEAGLPVPAFRYGKTVTWCDGRQARWSRQQERSAGIDATGRVADSIFRLADPGPWLAGVVQRVGRKFTAGIRPHAGGLKPRKGDG